VPAENNSVKLGSVDRLPMWITHYLSYGLEGNTERRKRRQFAWNSVCLFVSVVSSIFIIIELAIDWSFWPAALTVGLLTIFFLPMPIFFKINDRITVLVSIAISCACYVYVTYLLGRGAGVYFYLFAVPALALFVISVRNVTLIVFCTIMAAASIITCLLVFDEPALPAAKNEIIQIGFLSSSVLLTITLILGASYVAFLQTRRAEDDLQAEYGRSEMLLRNILPDPIALRLKAEPNGVIADRHEQVTVLFADIVDFTSKAIERPPEAVVELLNHVFSRFDALAEKHELEKIKTVGDAYMVVAGIPEAHEDGVAAIAEFALELIKETKEFSEETGETIEMRIGIHTGDAVAGVICTSKIAYDLWGDTVNTAARMEAFGVPNRIQITESVKDALEDRYNFEERGIVDVKGKGKMNLYFLKSRSIFN
jgi:adenylate cyclase